MQIGTGVQCVWEAGCLLGEGPVWDKASRTLYFVDIKGNAVLALREEDKHRLELSDGPATVVPIEGSNLLLCASGRGLERVDFTTGDRVPFGTIETDRPGNRPNDGKCDPAGRLWIGTMDDSERQFTGGLYRMEDDGRVTRMIDAIGISNGLDWSPDGTTFYYTDSMRRTIWTYAFDVHSGALGERRTFATIPEEKGFPDGLTVDAEGYVWSAHWDGACVTRYDPDGRIDHVLDLEVPRPTSVCFGGDLLDTLYITSARIGLSGEALRAAPLSGGLFAHVPGVSGRASTPVRI